MSEITQEIRNLIEPYLNEKGYEVYEIGYKREGDSQVLRLFVDNTTRTISLDDCADVSRMLSDVLDKTDIIPIAYNLEVSSPGLDRLLRNESDYAWAMNKTLKIKYTNDENKKVTIEGKLQKIENHVLEIHVNKKEILHINIEKIESARRVMKFDEIAPKK